MAAIFPILSVPTRLTNLSENGRLWDSRLVPRQAPHAVPKLVATTEIPEPAVTPFCDNMGMATTDKGNASPFEMPLATPTFRPATKTWRYREMR